MSPSLLGSGFYNPRVTTPGPALLGDTLRAAARLSLVAVPGPGPPQPASTDAGSALTPREHPAGENWETRATSAGETLSVGEGEGRTLL